jgi:hypothetical protein
MSRSSPASLAELAALMSARVVSSAAPSRRPGVLAPRCAALCKIAMGLTMGYMLVLML